MSFHEKLARYIGGVRGGGRGFSGARSSSIGRSYGSRTAASSSAYRGSGVGSSSSRSAARVPVSRSRISSVMSTMPRSGFFVAGAAAGALAASGRRGSYFVPSPDKSIRVDDIDYYFSEEFVLNGNCSLKTVPAIEDSTSNSDLPLCVDPEAYTIIICSKEIDKQTSDNLENLTFADGTLVDSLYWKCPEALQCCDWECCEGKNDGSMIFLIALGVFLFCVANVILFRRLCKSPNRISCCKKQTEEAPSDPARTIQPAQNTIDAGPLGALALQNPAYVLEPRIPTGLTHNPFISRAAPSYTVYPMKEQPPAYMETKVPLKDE